MKMLYICMVIILLLICASCKGSNSPLLMEKRTEGYRLQEIMDEKLMMQSFQGGENTPLCDSSTVFKNSTEGTYLSSVLPIKLSIKENIYDKIVFLTIDDGPSIITPGFLDVLRDNGVHATFCVIGNRAIVNPEIIKRAYMEGNSIINHSYDHEYAKIYRSPEALIESIVECNTSLDSIIQRTEIEKSFFRFPGGAGTTSIYGNSRELADILIAGGYNTIDWNISSEDCATGKATAEFILKNSIEDGGSYAAVILMHDFKYRGTTMEALPGIISYYKDKGYIFKTIRDMTPGDLHKLESKKIVNVLY